MYTSVRASPVRCSLLLSGQDWQPRPNFTKLLRKLLDKFECLVNICRGPTKSNVHHMAFWLVTSICLAKMFCRFCTYQQSGVVFFIFKGSHWILKLCIGWHQQCSLLANSDLAQWNGGGLIYDKKLPFLNIHEFQKGAGYMLHLNCFLLRCTHVRLNT